MPEPDSQDEKSARPPEGFFPVGPPETPKLCCGAVGKGVHLSGCPKRVRELADSGAFED